MPRAPASKPQMARPSWTPRRPPVAVPVRDAVQWLRQDPQWAGILQSVEQSKRIAQILQRHFAPAMAAQIVPAGLRGDTLVLTTASAALAAKCRQLEPSLLAALRTAGFAVKQLRWQVVARPVGANAQQTLKSARAATNETLAASAQNAFAKLHAELPDGPAKVAVAKLLEHANRGGTGAGKNSAEGKSLKNVERH